MANDLVQALRRRIRRQAGSGTDLITCSICLRVHRGSEWIAAERVIQELRSYNLETPPRLRPAVCDACADSIFSRRSESETPMAA